MNLSRKTFEEAEERRLAASYGQRMEQMDVCLNQTACKVNGYDEGTGEEAPGACEGDK